MPFVCDLQGYQDGQNEFVAKEFALVSLDGKYVEHFVFKTEPGKRYYSGANAWLVEKYHKLLFTDGNTSIEENAGYLRSGVQNIKCIFRQRPAQTKMAASICTSQHQIRGIEGSTSSKISIELSGK